MSNNQIERDKRINAEVVRIKEILKDIPQNVLVLNKGLIDRAAFMRITLEDYEKDIIENGSIELFSQSNKTAPYERTRPVVKSYNAVNRNYQLIIRQLADLLPPEIDKEVTLQDMMRGLEKPN